MTFLFEINATASDDIITIAPYIPVKIIKVRAEKTDQEIKRKDSLSVIKDKESEIESKMRKEERRQIRKKKEYNKQKERESEREKQKAE